MELLQYINPFRKSWGEVIHSTTRKEYWSFVLVFGVLNVLFSFLIQILNNVFYTSAGVGIVYGVGALWGLASFVLGLYSIGLFIGRFNDAGFSPALGIIVLLSPIWLGFLTFFFGGFVMILLLVLMIFTFWVLVQPSVEQLSTEYPETIVTEGEEGEVSFTMEDVPEEEVVVELSVETRRLIDWYVERHTDGVSREELIQAMRDAGHPEERITEVLQNV